MSSGPLPCRSTTNALNPTLPTPTTLWATSTTTYEPTPCAALRENFQIRLQPVDETVLLLIGNPHYEGRLVHDVAHAIALAG